MAKLTSELTSRERVQLALEHKTTDRIPIAMVCSGINPPAEQAFDTLLRKEMGLSLKTYLDSFIDILAVEPIYVGPRLEAGEDIWGVRRKAQSFGSGAYDEIELYPLATAKSIADLDKHRWPNPDWFDYATLEEQILRDRRKVQHCLMIHNANVFESTWYMRGFEQAFLDFYENSELIHAVLERVADFFLGYYRRILEVADGQVDLAFTADDIGGQNGLLMSPDIWETFIKPFHQRINTMIHEFGVRVIYHTDGAVMKAVPGLIDMGIDVLQALQFSARGMDPLILKDLYGDKLCFEGGVSVQTTLPFGSSEEVREEVRHLIAVLGKNGGYILGPSHAIQADTSPENILALFETAQSFYPF